MIKDFQEANKILAEYVPSEGIKKDTYNLSRMTKLMEKLGNPQDKYRVIHVAGTSGKTSTSYYISSLLKALGFKVGLTVSPYVNQVNERVQVGLVPLNEKAFCRELSIFIKKVESIKIKPTYFELLIAFAYWYFAKAKVEFVVSEVGLGGRLDGTNVVHREDKICVITDIGLDHTSILGDTVEKIAKEKAGIIKPGNHVFMNKQSKSITQVIEESAKKNDAIVHVLSKKPKFKKLPLFQQRNFALAKAVVSYIADKEKLNGLSKGVINNSQTITIPGRFEIIAVGEKKIILDGAHNYQKISMLFDSVEECYPSKKISVLASVTKRDSVLRSLREIIKRSDSYLFTSFQGGQDLLRKALGSKDINKIVGKKVNFTFDKKQALKRLLDEGNSTIVITGSIYFVSEMRKTLKDIKV